MAVAPLYNRSPIISFFELSEAQQEAVLDTYYDSREDAAEDQYVTLNLDADGIEVLPLGSFMRTEHSKIWDGAYGTSYFSGYYIKFNRSNDEALVALRFS